MTETLVVLIHIVLLRKIREGLGDSRGMLFFKHELQAQSVFAACLFPGHLWFD